MPCCVNIKVILRQIVDNFLRNKWLNISVLGLFSFKKGEILSDNNITAKRPGAGISPMKWDKVIGTVASKDYQMDDLI